MTYICTAEAPQCEFYERGECHNVEDCRDAKLVTGKPIVDWALRQFEKHCSTCKHCIDKEIWTCEIEEPCINHFYYEKDESEARE